MKVWSNAHRCGRKPLDRNSRFADAPQGSNDVLKRLERRFMRSR